MSPANIAYDGISGGKMLIISLLALLPFCILLLDKNRIVQMRVAKMKNDDIGVLCFIVCDGSDKW